MKTSTLKTVLRLTQIQSDRSAALARQARLRYEQAQAFSDQVSAYSGDYDKELARSALAGEGVPLLQARADFSARLHSTAQEQQQQAHQLKGQSQTAIEHAFVQQARTQAMDRFVRARQQQQRQQAEHRDEKELQDLMQSRWDRKRP